MNFFLCNVYKKKLDISGTAIINKRERRKKEKRNIEYHTLYLISNLRLAPGSSWLRAETTHREREREREGGDLEQVQSCNRVYVTSVSN